jgi:phosphoribosylformylglycinamidine (FGAM) synthase-like enzyme
MIFSRIRLALTNYHLLETAKVIEQPDYGALEQIYTKYCRYKQFKSVMPFFKEQYQQSNSEIIGYYGNEKLLAYSLILKYPSQKSVMAEQFAWDYESPNLRLGMNSLYHECEFYKKQGYEFMYLGEHSNYKSAVNGYELLGPA